MIFAEKKSFINDELLAIARELYGIELQGYNMGFLERRFNLIASRCGIKNVVDFKDQLVNNPSFALALEMNISVNVTEMFRNPEFFKRLTKLLANEYMPGDALRIWHPACSEGHEVFSLAILLMEKELLKNTMIYGTDISHHALNSARQGILNLNLLRNMPETYRRAGGRDSICNYFTFSYEKAIINSSIRKQTCFSYHQLGTDPPFRKFQVILCRNLFIYFDILKQNRMLMSLSDALEEGGILCMGLHEPIDHLPLMANFSCIDSEFKIYRKIKS